MAYREVAMVDVKEVLRLWMAGVARKRIAAQLGLDRRLVRKLGGGHLGHGTKATPAAPGSG